MKEKHYREELKSKIKYDKITGDYIFDNESENSNIKKYVSPVSVCWMIENACNLNCIYCFAEHKNLNDFNLNYKEIIKNILSLKPKTIILTGGEPTLNKDLKEILKYIGEKAVTIIDSNGTYLCFEELLPHLQNSVVRFSIDSLDTKVLEKVRPSKFLGDTDKQISKIENNIRILVSHNIPVIIQSVMTKYNINDLQQIYEFLLKNGVKRWYISAVKYSEKCEENYNYIGLSEADIIKISDFIEKITDINTSFSIEEDSGAKARLFIEKSGKFFVDTILNGIEYVGDNPYCPTYDEVYNKLDCEKHYDLYIKRKNLVRKK